MRNLKNIPLLFLMMVLASCGGGTASSSELSNEDYYRLFNEKTTAFCEAMNEGEYFSFVRKSTLKNYDVTEENFTYKELSDPLFIYSSEKGYFREENNLIMNYNLLKDSHYDRKYYSEKEDFDTSIIFDFNKNKLISMNINASNSIFSQEEDNLFKVEGKFKDIVDIDSKRYFLEKCDDIGLYNQDEINNYNMIVNYVFKEKSIEVDCELIINEDAKELKTNYVISLEAFEPFDFNHCTFTKPDCIQEATEETPIEEILVYEKNESAKYLYMKFEKGQYVLSPTDGNLSIIGPTVSLFDLKYNKINTGFDFIIDDYIDEYNRTFIVPEEGYYYVTIFARSGDSYKFEKLDYTTTADLKTPKILSSGEGTIEGLWDYEFYQYHNTSSSDQIIQIKNKSSNTMNIVCRRYDYYAFHHKIEAEGSLFVKVNPGLNNFYICSRSLMMMTEADVYNYSFEVSLIDCKSGINSDFNQLTAITDSFSKDYYLVGYGMGKRYLKLIVEQAGMYSFELENLDTSLSSTMFFNILDKKGNKLFFQSASSYSLEVGEYIVELSNNNHVLSVCKVRYVFSES